ncbi:MAG: hypothetical protein ACLUMK_11330 [Christensenellales bacterium]
MRGPADVKGPEYTPEKAGDALTFQLPRQTQTYTITAQAMQDKTRRTFSARRSLTALHYTITPEPPGSLTLRDYAEPLRLSNRDSSISVIGAPTASQPSEGQGHCLLAGAAGREAARDVDARVP